MLLFALILFVFVFWFRTFKLQKGSTTLLKNAPAPTTDARIPKSIMITNKDKTNIPDHIYKQYERHAKGYNLVVYDDKDCELFLKTEYPREVLDKFRSLRTGAHKADLFRYAYLYKRGGVYLDVKTVLLKDLDSFINHDEPLFYVVYTDQSRLYNGILCTPPGNEYFLRLLDDMVFGPPIKSYIQVCESAARILKEHLLFPGLSPGLSKGLSKGLHETASNIPKVCIWKEIFCDSKKHCNGKKDRYGFCNYCIDVNDTKLFKIRDDSYRKQWK